MKGSVLKEDGWQIEGRSLLLIYLEKSWLSIDQSRRLLSVTCDKTVCVCAHMYITQSV